MVKFFLAMALSLLCHFALANPTSTDALTAGYYKTKMLCGSTNMNRYIELGNIWYSSFMDAGLIPIIRDLANEGKFKQLDPGSEFDALVSDSDHFKAMEECFGYDLKQRNLFFTGLLAADISAKFSAWALDLSMIRILYFGIRATIAAGAAEMPQRLMWFRVFIRLAGKNRTVLTKIGDPIILTTFISSIYANNIAEETVSRQNTLNDLESKDPTIQKLQIDLKEMESLLVKTQNPQERAVLLFLIDSQKDTIRKIHEQYKHSRLSI